MEQRQAFFLKKTENQKCERGEMVQGLAEAMAGRVFKGATPADGEKPALFPEDLSLVPLTVPDLQLLSAFCRHFN